MLTFPTLKFLYNSLSKPTNNLRPLISSLEPELIKPQAKPYFQMSESDNQNQKKPQEPQHGRQMDNKKKDKNAKNKKKGNDDDDRSGGLLEPIIEDLQGWIKRRRPIPTS